jgi:meso-butanediol dehydrogenase / (S,S)-butanediol dehydrogenase / diacetyl reductase
MSTTSTRVVVVTGAASGIGRATSERFHSDGAAVVAVDLDAAALKWTEDLDHVVAVAGDVSREQTNADMVAAAMETFGRLDVAVLNAGIAVAGPIDTLPIEDFDKVVAVNLRGVVLGMQAVIPALKANGGGAIVATGSTSGLGGDPMTWPYNATKAAVINLVRAIALDVAHAGIRVNAVCPGPVRTPMTAGLRAVADIEAGLLANVPMRRWGDPGEIAATIAFLASSESSFITGVALPVDGGATARSGVVPLLAM